MGLGVAGSDTAQNLIAAGHTVRGYTRTHRGEELPPMAIQDLRHTAAGLAVSAGANVKAVQKMLGHKSVAMTLDVYADLFDDELSARKSALVARAGLELATTTMSRVLESEAVTAGTSPRIGMMMLTEHVVDAAVCPKCGHKVPNRCGGSVGPDAIRSRTTSRE
jgi:hypothetical protein